MFAELYIENLALIERAELVWQTGLNVLSGETGAGKSMLLDAVSLLLGSRADRDFIRRGADSCRVQGVFLPPFGRVLQSELAELGLAEAVDEDEQIILAREITANGRSVCRVNMRQIPLSAFRRIGRLLINIHGQMEHMLLLEPGRQLALLDSFGASLDKAAYEAAAGRVAVAWHEWQAAQNKLRLAEQELSDDAERSRLLEFQVEELSNAELKAGESEQLAREAEALSSVQKRSEYASQAYRVLYGAGNAIVGSLDDVVRDMAGLAELDPAVSALQQRLQSLYYELEDAALELRDYKDAIVDDPVRLDEINTRLFALKALGKKYGGDEEYLITLLEKSRAELERRENRDEYIAGLKKEAAQRQAEYMHEAAMLHRLREVAGGKLAERITAELAYLQMSGAVFGVRLNEKAAAVDGVDEAEFIISPNPGEDMKPVAKIASGGEMSRIMLAIKVILAGLDEVPTLIFDEIDTGLGGRALVSVAEKLVQVAGNTQAICVTHAPVLAAYADSNLLVEKVERDGRTYTQVSGLDEAAKVAEIGRMLAGDKLTETTIRQAEELIADGVSCRKIL